VKKCTARKMAPGPGVVDTFTRKRGEKTSSRGGGAFGRGEQGKRGNAHKYGSTGPKYYGTPRQVQKRGRRG